MIDRHLLARKSAQTWRWMIALVRCLLPSSSGERTVGLSLGADPFATVVQASALS